MRDGVGRIQGLAGHPITYSFILLMIVLILLYWVLDQPTKKRTKVILIISALVIYLLMSFTKSRFPEAILFMILILTWALRRKLNTRSIVLILLMMLSFFTLIFIFPNLMALFDAESGSVRMVGVQTGIKSLTQFPLLGTGIGTFGTKASFDLHSYVYDLFSVQYNAYRESNLASGVYFETGLFQKIVENGVLGTITYYYVFFRYLWKAYKLDSYLDFSLIMVILLNSILNPIYRLPGIFVIGICISHQNYLEYEKAYNINNNSCN